ncbi:S-layer homology domain-containing protein [Inediibacterium massiliense]|uniref:S-layer homology domain-containing protein n=1 Tax=Inediibacterium massiliense TaxID=1658111 RepID=UPI0006B534FD|nr:S-layer homology domain-containing protein [Inediibacterium massiliense]
MVKKGMYIFFALLFTIALSISSFADEKCVLSLQLEKTKIDKNEEIKGIGKLIYDEQPVSKGIVTIRVEGQKQSAYYVDQCITDTNGNFQIHFKIPKDMEEGQYFIVLKAFNRENRVSFQIEKKNQNSGESTGNGGTNSSGGSTPSSGGGGGGGGGFVKKPQDKTDSLNEEIREVKVMNSKGEFIQDAIGVYEKNTKDMVDTKKIGQTYEVKEIPKNEKSIKMEMSYDSSHLNGQSAEKLGLYHWNEQKKNWEYIDSSIDMKNNKVVASIDETGAYGIMLSTKKFEDTNHHWGEHAIEVMAARQVVSGVDPVNFAPNENITRAQFAKMIVSVLGTEIQKDQKRFTDVEENAWYAPYVEAAANLDIAKGSDGKFYPNKNITREEMAVMITKALSIIEPEKVKKTDIYFTDEENISNWAKESVSIAVSNGLLKGVGENLFSPKENATRAQGAQILYNLLKTVHKF